MDEMKLYRINGIIGVRYYDCGLYAKSEAEWHYVQEVHKELGTIGNHPRSTYIDTVHVLTGTLGENLFYSCTSPKNMV